MMVRWVAFYVLCTLVPVVHWSTGPKRLQVEFDTAIHVRLLSNIPSLPHSSEIRFLPRYASGHYHL